MIVDRFSQIELYASVHPDIPELLKALQEIDPATAAPGKYPVPGTDSFFMIQRYETRNQQKGIWEAHRKFIDLQYVVSGEELIGYQDIENLQEDIPYSDEKDAAFYRGAGTMVPVKAGTFMLLYPHDGHMPGIEIDEPGRVIKVVAKLPAVSVS